MNRVFKLAIGAAVLSILVASCGQKQKPSASGSKLEDWHSWSEKAKTFVPVIGKRGGEMRVSSAGSDAKTFNPITSTETSSWEVLQFVFDGLTEYDPINQQVVGGLAKEWKTSPDGLVWDFTLRDSLKWSDGEPITADDVVFSFKVIYDKKNIAIDRDNIMIDGKEIAVAKTGPMSVRFTLPKPFAPFLKLLTGTNTPVIPMHKLADAVGSGKFTTTWDVNTPVSEIVGSGPFRIARYEPSQTVVLERNDHYWKKDAAGTQLPYLDRIVFSYVKDNSAELLKFKNGETDFYQMRNSEYPLLKPLEAASNFTIYNLGPALGDVFLMFNENRDTNARSGKPYVDAAKLSWFRDKNFRQAVAFAINRSDMISIVHNGLAEPQYSPMGQASGYFSNPDVRKYAYCPDSAKALLAAGGFKTTPDGLVDPQGRKVEFSLVTSAGNSDRVKYCQMIAKDLSALGIKIDLTLLEFNNLVDKLDNTYNWDAMVIGLTGSDDPHLGAQVWMSTARTHQWYPCEKHPSEPWEARVDTIFTKAATLTDKSARKVLYDEWQALYSENLPYIEMPAPYRLFAVRNRFANVCPVPIAEAVYFQKRKFFWNIENVFVKQ